MQPIFKGNKFVSRNGDGEAARLRNVSRDIFERGLCLPSDIKMTAEEQDAVIEIIRSCFD
jgi:dTDP-4-amino-4,6-dideoxygalactose transaminase